MPFGGEGRAYAKRDPHPHPQVSVVGALSAFYPDSVNIYDENERKLSAVRHSQPQKPQTPQHLKTSKPQNFTATQQNPTPKLKPELKPTLTPPAPHPYAGAHDRQDADDRRARVQDRHRPARRLPGDLGEISAMNDYDLGDDVL